MKEVVIIGAGGHSRSVIANLQQNHFVITAIYDDAYSKPENILGIVLVGRPNSIPAQAQIVLAVGNNEARKRFFENLKSQVYKDNILHPSSHKEEFVKLGVANLIFANCYINNGVEIGDNNLINTGAILEHEVKVGSHNHISVGALLLGRSQIGNGCFIGANATVRDGVKLGDNVTIGAHSFVAQDILEPGTYVGSPARKVAGGNT